jgi:hypothetical protein
MFLHASYLTKNGNGLPWKDNIEITTMKWNLGHLKNKNVEILQSGPIYIDKWGTSYCTTQVTTLQHFKPNPKTTIVFVNYIYNYVVI